MGIEILTDKMGPSRLIATRLRTHKSKFDSADCATITIETISSDDGWTLRVSALADRDHRLVDIMYCPNGVYWRQLSSLREWLVAVSHKDPAVAVIFIVGESARFLAQRGSVLYLPSVGSPMDWRDSVLDLLLAVFAGQRSERAGDYRAVPRAVRDCCVRAGGSGRLGSDIGRASLTRYAHAATGGCFDAFHEGHRAFLEICFDLCDRLTVFLNTDRSVRALKGPGRPIWTLAERMAHVSTFLRDGDDVRAFAVRDAARKVRDANADVFLKGADYWLRRIPEAQSQRRRTPILLVDSIIEIHTSELSPSLGDRWGSRR